jgi:hypothetical protein
MIGIGAWPPPHKELLRSMGRDPPSGRWGRINGADMVGLDQVLYD